MLYSVREECARDLESTLREVAGMGYAGVELFNLHGHSAEQVREWLDRPLERISECCNRAGHPARRRFYILRHGRCHLLDDLRGPIGAAGPTRVLSALLERVHDMTQFGNHRGHTIDFERASAATPACVSEMVLCL